MTNNSMQQWVFLLAGLGIALLVIFLPSGTFWKNIAALMLVAIVVLAIYPVRRR